MFDIIEVKWKEKNNDNNVKNDRLLVPFFKYFFLIFKAKNTVSLKISSLHYKFLCNQLFFLQRCFFCLSFLFKEKNHNQAVRDWWKNKHKVDDKILLIESKVQYKLKKEHPHTRTYHQRRYRKARVWPIYK